MANGKWGKRGGGAGSRGLASSSRGALPTGGLSPLSACRLCQLSLSSHPEPPLTPCCPSPLPHSLYSHTRLLTLTRTLSSSVDVGRAADAPDLGSGLPSAEHTPRHLHPPVTPSDLTLPGYLLPLAPRGGGKRWGAEDEKGRPGGSEPTPCCSGHQSTCQAGTGDPGQRGCCTASQAPHPPAAHRVDGTVSGVVGWGHGRQPLSLEGRRCLELTQEGSLCHTTRAQRGPSSARLYRPRSHLLIYIGH